MRHLWCRESSSRPRANAAFFICGKAGGASLCGVHNSKQNLSLEDTMLDDAVDGKRSDGKLSEGKLFADSMLETSWAQRARRSWTTLTSFGVQVLAIACLLLLPLWKTIGLPAVRMVSTPVSLGRPAPEPVNGVRTAGAPTPHTNLNSIQLVAPGRVPRIVSMTSDDPSGPESSDPGPGIYTGLPVGRDGGLPNSLISGTHPVAPAPPPTISRAVRTSSMLEGNLIRRVQPVYPQLARGARIQGAVILAAVISKAGTIDDLRVVSGHPMLVRAAIDAVSQWRYRPYILNNEPIEVETQITVNFFLGGG
jgi:protein TonB